MKSQEKNILRREKEQEAGKSLLFSRNRQMCIWGSGAWRAKQRVQEMRGERKAGARFHQLLQAKVENSNVILGTAGNLQSSKQRRDTFYLNFLEDGLAALNDDDRGASMEAGSHPGTTDGVRWEMLVSGALVMTAVTTERNTCTCGQFRSTTERICQWIQFNRKGESDNLPSFVTYETGWPCWNLEKFWRPRRILRWWVTNPGLVQVIWSLSKLADPCRPWFSYM